MYKNQIIIFLFFLGFGISIHSQSKISEFGTNQGNLSMYIYVPKNLPKTNISLIVALHGCSQNAKTIAKQSGWNKLADKYQFIVIYPQQKRINNPSNCFNWFTEKDKNKESGENASIYQMINYTKNKYPIDSSNIYIYGLSAGAAMSVIMMANYPNTFQTGAILAGGPFLDKISSAKSLKTMYNPPNKTSKEWGKIITQNHNSDVKYPSLILVHGTSDKIVNIDNSYALVKQWSYLHQLDSVPNEIDSIYTGTTLVEKMVYKDSTKAEKIIFYKIDGIGHTLPIDPGNEVKQGGKTGIFAKDIGFFSTYYIARDFCLIKTDK